VAVDRNGRRFLHCEVGSRGTETGRKSWQAIEDQPITQVMTDYWRPYEQFVPKELHTQSKAETYTVEGYNSSFRHFLARLRRKSKCYSKSKIMLKWNGELDSILRVRSTQKLQLIDINIIKYKNDKMNAQKVS
jgi:insertion element IS1 protein InsB